MGHSKGLMKKSGVKDIILFQILEDTEYMIHNNCPSAIFSEPTKNTSITEAIVKIKKLFDINDDIDIDKEYDLILDAKSKLSATKRAVIKFLAIAIRNKDKKKPTTPEVVEGDVSEIQDPINNEVIDAEVETTEKAPSEIIQ